ncbi:ARM REPEAT PROTEIN INTERACTING WITH ABF2 [Trifolium repens]|nr:ARM REPEAT PROTEIN INTERACTING WITH ABF2 [Trifolium repens]
MFRLEGGSGIPPLVELLEFDDAKVQRAAAGALRTLAFQNAENKNLIVECDALPTLVLMLGSEDPTIHYEAVRYK